MRFYPRKAPRKKSDILLENITSGKGDDIVVSEFKVAISEIADQEELQKICLALLDIVLNSSANLAVAYALKTIMVFLPMTEEVESAIDSRIFVLSEDKSATMTRTLVEAMVAYSRDRVSRNMDISEPFVPALLLFMEEGSTSSAAAAYETLMSVTTAHPEFFDPHVSLLTRELGSINNTTRIYAAKIITKLATINPESMAETEKTLLHLSSFYPDADVKSAAAEAYQAITKGRKTEEPMPDATLRPEHDATGGLAEIMRKKASAKDKKQAQDSRIDNRLLSLAANFARKSDMRNGKPQPVQENAGPAKTDTAESEAMDKIIDDFSEIAGVITGDSDDSQTAQPTTTNIDSQTAQPTTTNIDSQTAQPTAASIEEQITREEAELREMVAKVKMDFAVSAESLLDALGMRHLHKEERSKPINAGVPRMASPDLQAPVQEKVRVVKAAEEKPDVVAAQGKLGPVEAAANSPVPQDDTAVIVMSGDPLPPPARKDPEEHGEFISFVSKVITEDKTSAAPAQPHHPTEQKALLVPREARETGATQRISEPARVQPVVTVGDIDPSIATENKAETTNPAYDSAEFENPDDPLKAQKSQAIPTGVRISAVKFKTLDQSKKAQAPATVSIKPHIKPLNRTPRDIGKIAQQRPQAANEARPAPAQKAEAVPANPAPQPKEEKPAEPTVCPACGEKFAENNQYCLKCGTDKISMKIKCIKCGQINARENGSCVRCGAKLIKIPSPPKPADVL